MLKSLRTSVLVGAALWAGVTWADFSKIGDVVWEWESEGEGNVCRVLGANSINGTLAIPDEIDGKTVIGIGDWAFEDSDMVTVKIPAGIAYLSGNAFAGCKNLKSFVVDDRNENFKFVDGLLLSQDEETLYRVGVDVKQTSVPERVKVIGECAFDGCAKLERVVLGKNVGDIQDYAFSGCGKLATIVVDAGNQDFKVENDLLLTRDGCRLLRGSAKLTSVVIPKGVKDIVSDAFSDIAKLKSVTISAGVEYIGESAFDGCTGLTSIDIPSSVLAIDEDAFEDCSKLETVVIGAGVEAIGLDAFAGCNRIKKIVFEGNEPGYGAWDDDEFIDVGADDFLERIPWADEEDNYFLFADAPSSCIVYVQQGTSWDTDYKIPGEWKGLKLRYGIVIGCEELENGTLTAGVNGNADGISLELPENAKKVSVSGLPSGMKYDKNTGKITGTPSRAGTYTVKIAVTTHDGAKDDKSITFAVDAINPEVVGTFKGFIRDREDTKFGTVQLTTTAAGKISAKIVSVSGTTSFSGNAWASVADDGRYSASLVAKNGCKLEITIDPNMNLNQSSVSGMYVGTDGRHYAVDASRGVFNQTWYFVANESDLGWSLQRVEDANAADLMLTMKGDGTTALKGKLGTLSVTTSGFVDLESVSAGMMVAEFAPVVSVRDGKKTAKRVLSITVRLFFSKEEEMFDGDSGWAKFAVSDGE